MKRLFCLLVALCVCLSATVLFADEKPAASDSAVYPIAVLPFHERSKEVAGQGSVVADILFANLVVDPSLLLVDREDIESVLKEQEINISGVVSPEQATQIGNIIGAKIIVTGSVIREGQTIYLVAKIIGTETTRVLGVSEKFVLSDPVSEKAEALAKKVAEAILQDGAKLVAKPLTRENRLETLRTKVGSKKLPPVVISIPESHLNRQVLDPAAETEMIRFCTELGFEVLDKKSAANKQAEIVLVGEAFSERGMSTGNLVSVKARVEVKAVDKKTGKVLAIDRQTTVAVDLAETIAAKTALQQAGAILAERMILKLVK